MASTPACCLHLQTEIPFHEAEGHDGGGRERQLDEVLSLNSLAAMFSTYEQAFKV